MIFLLFIIAIAGIGMELKNPGMIVPGTVGGISLVLFLLGIRIIPINALGLVLVILAFVLFILELKIQSFGLLTAGGIVSFFIGATILFDSPLPGGGITCDFNNCHDSSCSGFCIYSCKSCYKCS